MITALRKKLPAGLAALLILGLAATLAAPAVAAKKKPKPAKGVNINRAEARLTISDFSTADEMAAAILVVEPESFRAIHIRGQVALLENRLDEAETLLKAAIEIRPTHRKARQQLAQTYYRQDRFQEASVLSASLGEKAKAAKLIGLADVRPYASQQTSIRLPFVQTDPLPVVRVRINGSEPAAFIIDTGASEIVVDTEWAAEIGIESLGSTKGTFAGGRRADVGHGIARSVGLGEMILSDVPVQLLDTTPFSAVAPGEEIRGVLGTVLFYHFRTTLDYPSGELRLEPRSPEQPRSPEPPRSPEEGDDSIRIPFWLGGDHLVVARGRAGDSDPLMFLVDTGLAELAFTCPQSTIDEAGIDLPEGSAGQGVGGGGSVDIVPFLLERLSLGEAERSNLPGVFGPFPKTLEHSAGFRIAGIISHGFLRPWAVTFDFDSMELILRP